MVASLPRTCPCHRLFMRVCFPLKGPRIFHINICASFPSSASLAYHSLPTANRGFVCHLNPPSQAACRPPTRSPSLHSASISGSAYPASRLCADIGRGFHRGPRHTVHEVNCACDSVLGASKPSAYRGGRPRPLASPAQFVIRIRCYFYTRIRTAVMAASFEAAER